MNRELFIVFQLALCVWGDVYLHNPRGSNNRLNEQSAERNNANRVFDSQNNNRGGYNVGVIDDNDNGNNEDQHYRMKFFQSGANYKVREDGEAASTLKVEWTNQHGCGGNEDSDPHKQNCNLVFQYLCQPDSDDVTGDVDDDLLRNGAQTNTQNYNQAQNNENENQANNRKQNSVATNRVLQETFEWYDKCYVKERNKGLFTADQVLTNDQGLGYSAAIYTRQNPNGNRRGYECPEERDYYPYFHPSPWKDAAVLSENITMCEYYRARSFNVQPYHECVEYWDGAETRRKHYSRWNNEEECTANDGEWRLFHNYLEKALQYTNEASCEGASGNGIEYEWAVPYDAVDGKTEQCLVKLDAPECYEAPWSRSNHLGNGRTAEANTFEWKLPYFPSGEDKRCVFRLRYNISTDDYDPFNTDHRHNEDTATGQVSPVEQNPYVEIGGLQPLRLAINTAQFGRTFQDRSHVFKLRARPAGVGANDRIFNVNVRGKRGNIVQVYPAVEYDFIPNDLKITPQDLVHFQWTGSNTHNNGNPGGDGQTGDAGEGTGGTDRSNIVQTNTDNENFPVPFENSTMWDRAEVVWIHHGNTNLQPKDIALGFASSGYYHCFSSSDCTEATDNNGNMNNQLNNAPPSYEGALLRFQAGEYNYICSRNNNFTNRGQKGKVTVR